MPKLKNLGEAVDLYFPAGHGESLSVDAGQVVEVPGELADDKALAEAGVTDVLDDAHLIRMPNGEVRAFPHSRWELTDEVKSKRKSPASTGE